MSKLLTSTTSWTTTSIPPKKDFTLTIVVAVGVGVAAIGVAIFLYKCRSKTKNSISGITNTGSSCYLNSVIQMLASSEMLLEEITQIEPKSNELTLFNEILNDVNTENTRNIHKKLNELVKQTGWQKTNQQDVFDLLSNLVNGIEDSLVNQKLPLKLKLISKYLENAAHQPNEQDYLGLSLNLFGEYSKIPGIQIEDMIKNHFEPAMIDDDPKKIIQNYWFSHLPTVLLIHVQANVFVNQKMMKPKYYIQYGDKLQFNCDVKQRDGSITKCVANYQLVGLVEHRGSISGGHYTCIRKHNDKWYHINDGSVSLIMTPDSIMGMSQDIGPKSPYLFLYDKINVNN